MTRFIGLCLIFALLHLPTALGEELIFGQSLYIEIPSADSIMTNPGQSRITVGDTVYTVIDGGVDFISTIQAFDRKTWSFYEMNIAPETIAKASESTDALLVGQIQFRQLENSGGTCSITVLDGDYQTGEYTVESRVFPSDIYQEFIYLKKGPSGEYKSYRKLYLIQYAPNGRQRNEYAVVSITRDAPPASPTPDPVLSQWIVETTEQPSATPTLSPTPTASPSPTPSSTPTATPTPTLAPTPTPSPTPTATPSPTLAPTPTPSPTPTATPSPTLAPTPTPTAIPVPPLLGKEVEELMNLLKQWLPLLVALVLLLAVAAPICARLLKARRNRPVRFFKLNRIDVLMKLRKPIIYEECLALDQLCERFHNFAAGELKLYYDIKLIRLFIAGLSVSRLTIMQGISGTGKTSLAYACGKFFMNDAVIVPVQPAWRDRSDMLGYFNEFSKQFNETTLLEKLYEAGYTDEIYITVLDEMNIARVEYYFAEFLSVLEMPAFDEWLITVVPDEWKNDPVRLRDGKIRLPRNMWYIGTANNDDSTFAISDKVYDRAMVIDLDSKAEPFSPAKSEPARVSAEHLLKLFEQARASLTLSEETEGKISALDRYLMERLRISFGNRIMRQIQAFIPVYQRCGGTEREALDYLLCKKVLRKLENQNPMFVRDEIDGLCGELNRLFGAGETPECLAYLQRLKRMG